MSENYAEAFKEGRNLTEASTSLGRAPLRAELAATAVQFLARRRSVLLIGGPGVGKTRVVHEVVSQLRELGRAQVYEFSIPQLLTGTKYLGEWETKVSQIVNTAVASDAILYFSDLWNLPTAARSSNRDGTAWDLFRPYLEQGRLRLIGEMTTEQLQRVSSTPGFTALFETVQVPQFTE